MGSLFTAHDGGENLKLRLFGQFHHAIAHLVNGLRGYIAIAMGTMGFPGAAKEQSEIVINFRNGTHGRTRIVGSGLLIDGDSGTQPLYRVYIGFI